MQIVSADRTSTMNMTDIINDRREELVNLWAF